jgi:hypothetical membrane protein
MTVAQAHPHRATPDAHQHTVLWWAVCGVVGPALFVGAFTLAGVLRPGYSPVRQAITALGNGPNGWIEWSSAIATGVLLVIFALGFGRALPGGSTRVTVLLALPGLGLALAGMTDAPEYRLLHAAVSQIALWSAAVAFLVTGMTLRQTGGWSGWGVYSLCASVLTLGLIGLTFASAAPGAPLSGLGGLTERLVVIDILAWYATTSARVLVGGLRADQLGQA